MGKVVRKKQKVDLKGLKTIQGSVSRLKRKPPGVEGHASDQKENGQQKNCQDIGDILPLGLIHYLRLLMRRQPLLRSDWQTMDFYQELSVRFISSLAKHAFLELPEDHRAALVLRMARQVGKDHLKQVQRKKRDCRRIEHGESKLAQAKYTLDPSSDLVSAETVAKVREMVSLREWSLLEMFSQGHTWEEIAKELGGTPCSQRMRHIRLVRRLARLPI